MLVSFGKKRLGNTLDAISFRDALLQSAPRMGALLTLGLSESEATEIIESFHLMPRPPGSRDKLPDQALADLFSLFEAGGIEIGMVRLLAYPQTRPYGYVIGHVETDELVLEGASGHVTVRDGRATDHKVWDVAKDGDALLSALAAAASCLSRRLVSTRQEPGEMAQTLSLCTSLAGGPAYKSFYQMLLGE